MTRSVGPSVVLIVDEITKVGEARRRSIELAARFGFDEEGQGKVALVVTEAATNLVKHSGGGQLILEGLRHGSGESHLEILTVDSGQGMGDLSRCMADGYSSAGSPGTGLGAINRVADRLEIYSEPGKGTILWARLVPEPESKNVDGHSLELGVVRVCAPGELVCGDDWATIERDGKSLIMMVDGLGHGSAAADAAEGAVGAFLGLRSFEPAEILESIHRSIRGTRGAALAIVRIDPAGGHVRCAGVGNISSLILDTTTGETKSMVSLNGTVGHSIRKVQSFDYPWTQDAVLLMHSDGMATHWNVDRYPGIMRRHPSLLAGALYRDHTRGRDDVTILVACYERGGRK
jgi:anti-sigma regulatory factor (Ser/Thr protein kinase)